MEEPLGKGGGRLGILALIRKADEITNGMEDIMCASCGCGKFNDDHGDDRHITGDQIRDAAEAADISVTEVVNNLQQAAQQEAKEKAGQRSR
jgi:predicted  nucleic acid-binding Zn-ribbon protein